MSHARSLLVALFLVATVLNGCAAPASPPTPAPAPPPAAPVATPPPSGELPAVPPTPRPDPGGLNRVGQFPLPGAVYQGEAVFYFDKPLALTADQSADTASLVTTEPPTAPRVQVTDNYVRVQTSEKLGSTVTLTLSGELRSTGGMVASAEDRTLRFATSAPQFSQLSNTAPKGGKPVLTILFSQPVDNTKAADYITVTDANGDPADMAISAVDDRRVNLVYHGDANLPVQVKVRAGLPGRDGLSFVAQDTVMTYPVKRTLKIEEPDWWGDEEGRALQIRFSNEVDPETLEKHLTLVNNATGDALAYTLQNYGNRSRYRVDLLKPPAGAYTLRIGIRAGLQAEDEAVVYEDWSAKLVRHAPQLAVEGDYWQEAGAKGYAANVYFNYPLDSGGFKEFFAVSPKLDGLEMAQSDNNQVQITGDWRAETEYTLEVKAGYRDGDGNELKQPLRYTVNSGEIPPHVAFTLTGANYFPRRGEGELPLVTRNVKRVTHHVYRLFPNNFVTALDALQNDNYYDLRDRWSEEIATQTVDVQETADHAVKTIVPLDKLLPENERGLFLLEARAEEGPNDFKIMVNTDLGVLAHWKDDQLLCYVHDLFTLQPAIGAKVSVYSEKNQFLAEGIAGPDGKVLLSGWNESLGTPKVLMASLGDDFTYLELDQRSDTIPTEIGARDPYDTKRYEAFLYADRDLYRPSETAHLRWIVRRAHTEAVANVPLKLTVYQPNGTEIFSAVETLNALGTGGHDLATEKVWPTGRYWARLSVPGADDAIGSYALNIEEFVPNQIEVDMDVSAPFLLAGQAYPVNLTARHLFGTPASDRLGEVYAVLTPGNFQPQGYDGFTFTHDNFNFRDRMEAGEKSTDENGQLTLSISHPEDERLTQPVNAQIVAEISEEGGRPVTKTADRMLFGSENVLGLRARVDGTPGEVVVDVAALKPDGSAAALNKATVTLERRDWSYYVRDYHDHYSTDFTPRYEKLQEKEVDLIDGKATLSFSVERWGNYRVRVHSAKTPMFATQQFYHSGYYTTLVKEDAPSLVTVKLDQAAYNVGDTARIALEAPFKGRAVVVLQNADLLDLHTVEFADGKAELTIPLEQRHFPNFWVEVTAVYVPELGTTQMHPFSSFGMAYVPVYDPALKVAVSFPDLPESVRPAQNLPVTVQAMLNDAPAANAEITLVAVDAGILNITDFATPAPYAWLTRPRYPDLRRNHYYDGVAYDFLKTPIGGDGAALSKRVGDDMQNWIETVALWSGVVTTDADGRAQVPLDLPEFNGRLRLMAVATLPGGAVGSGEAPLLVRRPYILRPSVPRFVDPGDTFDATLTFFNNGPAPVSIDWRAVAGGQLVAGEHQGSVSLQPASETSVRVTLTAGDSGPGTLSLTASVRGEDQAQIETLEKEMQLPVRVPAVWQQHRDLVVVAPGEKVTLENTLFAQNDRLESGLVLSASPGVQLFDALEDLIGYPYGCVEQTTSKLMPLYLLRQTPIIESMAGKEIDNIDNFLRAGVDQLMAMQTPEGGLAMWRGGRDPYPYGSVYATHLLTLLRRDKLFVVDDEPFRLLQQYVWKIATGEIGTSGPYSPSNQTSTQLQRAYALFVMALDGNVEALQRIEGLVATEYPRTARYLLAAALAMNNPEHPAIAMFMADVPNEMYDARELQGALNSRVRNEAMELLSKTYLKVDEKENALLAERLIAWLKDQRYGSTQEKAFVISALGAYLSEVGRNIDQTVALVSGPQGEAKLEGGQILRQDATGAAEPFIVENKGATTLYASFATAGIPLEPPTEAVSEGMGVSRTVTDLDGNAVTGAFQQGQTYRVKLEVTPDNGVANVVVSDLLPAGFEVENSRLSGIANDAPDAKRVLPEHLDIRDDRVIIAYRALSAGKTAYTYTVRAVTPGTYQHPPVTAECMYDPAIRARNLPGTITVEAR